VPACFATHAAAAQTKVERCARAFKDDACKDGVCRVLRAALRQHAEMAHITTNLQYYINLEVVECEFKGGLATPCCVLQRRGWLLC
jgi:hypothetical protein